MTDPLIGKVQSFSVPFPPAVLSPNSRKHWTVRNRARVTYQKEVWAMMKNQKIRPMADAVIGIEMTFFPPANYAYDDDNLAGRMKAGRDQIAKFIGVDDKIFRQAQPIIAGKEPPHGRVQIVLRPAIVNIPHLGVIE
jgi:crossover junction endodeoxyribonuclease RusA